MPYSFQLSGKITDRLNLSEEETEAKKSEIKSEIESAAEALFNGSFVGISSNSETTETTETTGTRQKPGFKGIG